MRSIRLRREGQLAQGHADRKGQSWEENLSTHLCRLRMAVPPHASWGQQRVAFVCSWCPAPARQLLCPQHWSWCCRYSFTISPHDKPRGGLGSHFPVEGTGSERVGGLTRTGSEHLVPQGRRLGQDHIEASCRGRTDLGLGHPVFRQPLLFELVVTPGALARVNLERATGNSATWQRMDWQRAQGHPVAVPSAHPPEAQ